LGCACEVLCVCRGDPFRPTVLTPSMLACSPAPLVRGAPSRPTVSSLLRGALRRPSSARPVAHSIDVALLRIARVHVRPGKAGCAMRCGGGGALDSELQVDHVGAPAGASRPWRPLLTRGLDAEDAGVLAGASCPWRPLQAHGLVAFAWRSPAPLVREARHPLDRCGPAGNSQGAHAAWKSRVRNAMWWWRSPRLTTPSCKSTMSALLPAPLVRGGPSGPAVLMPKMPARSPAPLFSRPVPEGTMMRPVG
jgi:hypothetical protein